MAQYNALAPIYMKPTYTEEEWRRIADDFEQLWDMPRNLGAIDGKHIRMVCPKNTGTLYRIIIKIFSVQFFWLYVCDA